MVNNFFLKYLCPTAFFLLLPGLSLLAYPVIIADEGEIPCYSEIGYADDSKIVRTFPIGSILAPSGSKHLPEVTEFHNFWYELSEFQCWIPSGLDSAKDVSFYRVMQSQYHVCSEDSATEAPAPEKIVIIDDEFIAISAPGMPSVQIRKNPGTTEYAFFTLSIGRILPLHSGLRLESYFHIYFDEASQLILQIGATHSLELVRINQKDKTFLLNARSFQFDPKYASTVCETLPSESILTWYSEYSIPVQSLIPPKDFNLDQWALP